MNSSRASFRKKFFVALDGRSRIKEVRPRNSTVMLDYPPLRLVLRKTPPLILRIANERVQMLLPFEEHGLIPLSATEPIALCSSRPQRANAVQSPGTTRESHHTVDPVFVAAM